MNCPSVSRETSERLAIYFALLKKWQRTVNLVSEATLDDGWFRHVIDSLQLINHAPQKERWVDIGSGGGLPGIPIAIGLTRANALVHLVERDARKCVFLREAIRETGAAAVVHHGDAIDVLPRIDRIDVVTARAVSQLERLIELAQPALKIGAIGLFLKGQHVGAELTCAPIFSNVNVELLPSVTGGGAVVRVVSRL